MKKLFLFSLIILMSLAFVVAESTPQVIDTKWNLNPFGNKQIIIEPVKSSQIDTNDFMYSEGSYDYPITQISKTFLWVETDKVAEYKITDNTDQCLTNCFTEGKAILYQDGKLFDTFNFFDKKGKEELLNYKVYIRQTEYLDVIIPDYKEECSGEGNKTICENVKVGEHKESQTRESWEEYNGEELKAGNYIWRIEGSKLPMKSVDMIPSAQGVALDSYIWWDNSWTNCKNITIATSLTQNEAIMTANLTGLTFSNITEIRIINAGCGLNGAEVKSTVLSNDSNWAYVTWFANLTGSNAVYSVYYNNPTDPIKTLEASPDFCEFDDICGWENYSAQGYITDYGTWNTTATSGFNSWQGIYSPLDIGQKSLTVRYSLPDASAYLAFGETSANGLLAFNNAPAKIPFYSMFATLSGDPSSVELYTYDGTTTEELGSLISAHYRFYTAYFNITNDGYLDISVYNSTIVSEAISTAPIVNLANLSLGIGATAETWSGEASIDYLRAYDTEASYISDFDMPTFTLGSEELLASLNITQNSPDDYYNSTISSVTFNCTATDSEANIILNLTLSIGGVDNYTLSNSNPGNISFEQSIVMDDGSYTWQCYASNDNGDTAYSATRNLLVHTQGPLVNIVYPANGTEFTTDTIPINVEFNVSVSELVPDTCTYYNYTFPDITDFPCVSDCGTPETLASFGDNVTLPLNYGWTFFNYTCNDSLGIFGSDSIYVHVLAGIPQFSNYWDDNATLIGEGIGSFNVTLANTNGTVLLEINGENVTATNETSNVYNASYNFTQDGIYDYLWHSWSADGTYNQSELQSYIVLPPLPILSSPINYYNSSLNNLTFECSENDSIGVINLTLIIDGEDNYTLDGGVGQNLSLSYLITDFPDGLYNWTCLAIGGYDGLTSSQAVEQYFTIDSTPPDLEIIDFKNASELFCQDEFPCNVTFTINVSDSNPDTCMYYNCTPIYLLDLETCEGSYESLAVYGDNVTLYWNYGWEQFNYTCNDTFGNVATQSVLTFVNNINTTTFNTPVTVGSNQLFVAEVYYDPDYFTELNVQFEYNHTNYTGDYNQIDVSDRQYYKNFVVPSIPGNYSFDWFIQLINNSDTSFWLFGMNWNASGDGSPYEQEVIGLNMDNCSVNQNNIMNLTLIDESQQTPLNTNIINVDIIIKDYLGENVITNFSQQYNDTNPVSICIDTNLTTEQLSLTSIIEYSSDDHAKEYYNIVNSTLNASDFYNITLFDLLSTENTDFKLTFSDDYYIPYPDVLVYVNRQYISEGVYKTVELPMTDAKGQAILHLIRNNQLYQLQFVKNGVVLANFENLMPFCADYSIGDCEINLNMNQVVGNTFNSDRDLGISYTPITYDNSTKIVSFSFNSIDGSNKCVYLNVTRNDILGNRSICSKFVQTTSGSVYCTIPDGVDDSAILTSASLDSGCAGNPVPFLEQGISLKFVGYGAFGYLLAFIFLLSFILMLSHSKEGTLIGIILGFVTSFSLGLIYGLWKGAGASGIWIIVIIIIMLWKMNRGHPN